MTKINTNIEDYEVSDLVTILGLTEPYSSQEVNRITDQLIWQKTREGKKNIALFFEQARNKILNSGVSSNNSDDYESSNGGEEASNEESVSEEDEEISLDESKNSTISTKEDSIMQPGDLNYSNVSEEKQQFETKGEQNKFPVETSVTHVISIDTRFRPNYENTLSTSFTFDLPEVQKKVTSMTVACVEMPMTYYSVSSSLENNSFLILTTDVSYSLTETFYDCSYADSNFDPDQKAWLVQLEDGNYDTTWYTTTRMTTTIDAVNQAITEATPGAIDKDGIFSEFLVPISLDNEFNSYLNSSFEVDSSDNITYYSDLVYGIDTMSKKTRFVNTSTRMNIISAIRFNINLNGNISEDLNIQCKLGWMLGFRDVYYEMSEYTHPITGEIERYIVSEGTPFLSGLRYCFLSINDYQNSSRPSFVVAYSNSTKTREIMSRINLSFAGDANLGGRDAALTTNTNRSRNYDGPVDIQRLTVTLHDEYGRIIDLNNMDWSFALAFTKNYK